MDIKRTTGGLVAATLAAAAVVAVPVYAHHSFSIFDAEPDEDLHRCRHARESRREPFADLLRGR